AAAPHQPPPGSRGPGRFLGEYDLNHDSKVTRAEFGQAVAHRFAAATGGARTMTAQQFADDATRRFRDRETLHFRRADCDGDGPMSRDESLARLHGSLSASDRRGAGVISCAPRANRPAAQPAPAVRVQDAKTPARRRGGASRGLCPSNDLSMDGKVTRAEFD